MIKTFLSGRIGNSEYKQLGSGVGMIKFSVASTGWDSKEKKKTTDWIDCVLFGKRADNNVTQQMLSKGTSIAIDGLLNINQYEKDDGTKIKYYSVFVNDFDVLSSSGQKFNDKDVPAEYDGVKVSSTNGLSDSLASEADSEDIPF